MKTVTDRVFVGNSDMGHVFVYHFAGSPDDSGVLTEHKYQVRAGNQTVTTKATEAEALAVANALVGKK